MKWKAYPEYRDSRVEWLDRVPTHWQCYPLKRLVTLVNEKAGTAEELPYIGLENVESWTGRLLETEAESDSLANRFAPTDILFGKLRPYLAKALAPAFAGRCTSELLVLRPHRIERRFLLYCLLSKGFIETVNASTFGVKMPRADWPFIGGLKIGLPSLDEQRAIAAFLDHETARIDAMIAKKERLIALLEEKRTALISQAVTKGLDPNAPMKESEVEWLGRVPAHWIVAPLYGRYEVRLGKMLDEKRITGEYLAPYLRNVDVQWDHVRVNDLPEMDFLPEERRRLSLQRGDLLVCEGGEVGRTAQWRGELSECYYQKAIHRLRPTKPDEHPRFFYYLMRAAATGGMFTATGNPNTIDHLTAEKLRHHRFAFPPPGEQCLITEYLDRQTTELERLARYCGMSVTRFREYRTALISAAVTGKIDVREAR